MNLVILSGRMTKKIELKSTQNGKSVGKFSLAVQNAYDKEKADFIDCVIWDNQAETLEKYTDKGSKISIEGRLSVRTWEDNDKNKRKTTEVIVERFEFLDSKKKEDKSEEEESYRDKNNGEDMELEFPF